MFRCSQARARLAWVATALIARICRIVSGGALSMGPRRLPAAMLSRLFQFCKPSFQHRISARRHRLLWRKHERGALHETGALQAQAAAVLEEPVSTTFVLTRQPGGRRSRTPSSRRGVAASEMTHARAVTPVPGGVGPMTIACLLSNTLRAAKGVGDELYLPPKHQYRDAHV